MFDTTNSNYATGIVVQLKIRVVNGCSASAGHLATLRLLLDDGASVDSMNKHNNKPIDLAPDMSIRTLLHTHETEPRPASRGTCNATNRSSVNPPEPPNPFRLSHAPVQLKCTKR